MKAHSLLPFCVILFSLLSSVHVFSLGNHSRASHITIYPRSVNNSYFALRGSVFQLNCTVRSGFGQVLNVSWKHNDKWLFDRIKQIDKSTVQLQVLNTSTLDNGFYWCGLISGNKSQGVNISVTVADPPSLPRNLNYKIYGVYPYTEVWIRWSSSHYTGGLVVNYSIKLCHGNSDCSKPPCKLIDMKQCPLANIRSTTTNFRCILKNFVYTLGDCQSGDYNVSVVATNAVGSAQSSVYLPYITQSSVIPWPPKDLSVEPTDREGELMVRWKARGSWVLSDQEYMVLYHAKGEMENKTNKVSNKEFTKLTKLKDFMEYSIYLEVRLLGGKSNWGNWSEATGPKIVKTKAGNPDNPPKVIRHHSVYFPDNSGLRNVTVVWEPADNSSWRGTHGQYIISCTFHVNQSKVPGCEYTTDAKATNLILPRLENALSYDVFVTIRNMEGKSSSRSEPHLIEKVQENKTLTTQEGKSSSKGIAWLIASVVVGCLIAGVAVYYLRKWRLRPSPPMSLRNLELDLPQFYDYPNEEDCSDPDGDYCKLYEK